MITQYLTVYSKETNTQKNRNTPDNLLQDVWINIDLLTATNLKWYIFPLSEGWVSYLLIKEGHLIDNIGVIDEAFQSSQKKKKKVCGIDNEEDC